MEQEPSDSPTKQPPVIDLIQWVWIIIANVY